MKSVPYTTTIISLMYAMAATHKYNACGWSRKQIYAQLWPITLERSEAYL